MTINRYEIVKRSIFPSNETTDDQKHLDQIGSCLVRLSKCVDRKYLPVAHLSMQGHSQQKVGNICLSFRKHGVDQTFCRLRTKTKCFPGKGANLSQIFRDNQQKIGCKKELI